MTKKIVALLLAVLLAIPAVGVFADSALPTITLNAIDGAYYAGGDGSLTGGYWSDGTQAYGALWTDGTYYPNIDFKFNCNKAGVYKLIMNYESTNGSAPLGFEIDGKPVVAVLSDFNRWAGAFIDYEVCCVELSEGKHTVSIIPDQADMGEFYFKQFRFEDASDIAVVNDNLKYDPNGQKDVLYEVSTANKKVINKAVYAPEAGTYTLGMLWTAYWNGSVPETADVYVNGVKALDAVAPSVQLESGYNNIDSAYKDYYALKLEKGVNNIQICATPGYNYVYIECMDIARPVDAFGYATYVARNERQRRFEMSGANGHYFEFPVYVLDDGTYALNIHWCAFTSGDTAELFVNGDDKGSIKPSMYSGDGSVYNNPDTYPLDSFDVTLKEGVNTIKVLSNGSSWLYYDYATVAGLGSYSDSFKVGFGDDIIMHADRSGNKTFGLNGSPIFKRTLTFTDAGKYKVIPFWCGYYDYDRAKVIIKDNDGNAVANFDNFAPSTYHGVNGCNYTNPDTFCKDEFEFVINTPGTYTFEIDSVGGAYIYLSTQNAVELVSVNELEISDVEFSDYSKNPVTSVDSVTSSDLNVATTIANYTDKTQKYIVVLAEYGAYGNLINAKALTSGTLAPLGVANVQELYTPVSLDAAKVKVFIFDDLNTISPLMDAAVLN